LGTVTITTDLNASVSLTGVSLSGLVGIAQVYSRIDPDQTPNWIEDTPSQIPSWTEETPNQTSNWTEIPT